MANKAAPINWQRIEHVHVEMMMSNAGTSILILFSKFLTSAVLHPNSMTVMKVRVQSEKVTPGTFAVMVASFEMLEEELLANKRK